ncbi:hypothetical protein KM915_10280 [Cytobacillus oceanisediminis]|uniref:hypothetical protein n=1 Tax=Cytobacillus oceanisediminis TaxID=665099 RepID=UPI001C212407|nr:hypothetical protein [Cytobacillus oceanisediminis]MBU8730440.1 hypothetical protein [Cytobacillus oceanisediminis]
MANWLIETGLKLMPFSMFVYLPFRTFLYIIRKSHVAKLVKAIWYLALGLGYVTGLYDVNYVVMFICFIEAWDLFHDYREGKSGKIVKAK